MYTARRVGCEVSGTNEGQQILIAVLGSKFAKSACSVIDSELEVVAGTGFNQVIYKVGGIGLLSAPVCLFAQGCAVLGRHELPPGLQPVGFGRGEQLRREGFQRDVTDHVEWHAAAAKDTAD